MVNQWTTPNLISLFVWCGRYPTRMWTVGSVQLQPFHVNNCIQTVAWACLDHRGHRWCAVPKTAGAKPSSRFDSLFLFVELTLNKTITNVSCDEYFCWVPLGENETSKSACHCFLPRTFKATEAFDAFYSRTRKMTNRPRRNPAAET